jgi:hypothetical protein
MPLGIATLLLEKLREINRAIKRGDSASIPSIILEAEDCVMQMERELLLSLNENERLRRPG